MLAEARNVSLQGNRIQQQTARLSEQLELASKQVTVVLQSDSQCNVLVYKVARLGQFNTTELLLYPGRYTAVGSRDGYRDVRHEFLVQPGQSRQPVVITCNEKV